MKHEEKLDDVFNAYRQACPDSEPSSNFMPELWRKIEARRKTDTWVWRWLNAAVASAALLTLITGYIAFQGQTGLHSGPMPQRAYIEKLTDEISEDDFLEASYVPASYAPAKFTRPAGSSR